MKLCCSNSVVHVRGYITAMLSLALLRGCTALYFSKLNFSSGNGSACGNIEQVIVRIRKVVEENGTLWHT